MVQRLNLRCKLNVFLSSFKFVKKTFIIVFIFLLSGYMAFSQQSRQAFGQNRVQSEYFDWRYYSTTNFDIYFYGSSDKTAEEVAIYLEDEFDRITEVIGHSPYFKAKVFMYNSVNDLQQSNIGVNQQSYRIGGQTNLQNHLLRLRTQDRLKG